MALGKLEYRSLRTQGHGVTLRNIAITSSLDLMTLYDRIFMLSLFQFMGILLYYELCNKFVGWTLVLSP